MDLLSVSDALQRTYLEPHTLLLLLLFVLYERVYLLRLREGE